MSPQFVDFNADGHIDILAGIFGGSPLVSWGSAQGFAQPERILDVHGERLVLNQFWNYDSKKWDTTQRCDAPGQQVPEGQGTSAIAFDWDGDGDFDLLMGDYKTGRIYRRMNSGTKTEHKYDGVNLAVMLNEAPVQIPENIETLRAVDWDKNGLLDLVCGSVGHPNERRSAAGVYVLLNLGSKQQPNFASPRALVIASTDANSARPLPYAGFYPDVGDFDGDGDLDLVLGAKAHWTVPFREHTEAEVARLPELKQALEAATQALTAYHKQIEAQLKGLEEQAAADKRRELRAQSKATNDELVANKSALEDELDALTFGTKDGYRVLLYERVGN